MDLKKPYSHIVYPFMFKSPLCWRQVFVCETDEQCTQ